MKHSFEHYRNDVFVIPNGISVDRFDRFTVPPSDLARIPRPWVGYAGTITSRVDEELVAWLAEQRQNVHFVFLGPLMDPARFRSLFKHPNVHYLGNKHYSDLPDYLLNFDVSIIPHRTGRHENDGDSLKVFEYLASGKPVVSTNTLDIAEAVWPVIKRCSSRESFLSALDEYLALSEAERQALASQLRLAIPPERDWNFLTRKAISVIQGKLREISSQIELNQF
jgi:UDP-galactopyranose mutase